MNALKALFAGVALFATVVTALPTVAMADAGLDRLDRKLAAMRAYVDRVRKHPGTDDEVNQVIEDRYAYLRKARLGIAAYDQQIAREERGNRKIHRQYADLARKYNSNRHRFSRAKAQSLLNLLAKVRKIVQADTAALVELRKTRDASLAAVETAIDYTNGILHDVLERYPAS